MKAVLAIIIGIFLTTYALADCPSDGLYAFPSGATIRQNPIFVLEGYGQSQRVINGIGEDYNVYLQAGTQKIKLIATETLKGQFRISQAILKPERKLTVGVEYSMIIEYIYEELVKYNPTSDKFEPVKYKVISGKDLKKPVLYAQPKEIRKTLVHYGCGPSTHVIFDLPVQDESEIIVKTTLINLDTGFKSTYYIKPWNNNINIGHGMCSGPFKFNNGTNYEVQFSFMDASGNMTLGNSEKTKFTKPTVATSSKDE